MYETPLAVRLLYESLDPNMEGDRNPYLDFALWAVADDQTKLESAAERTVQEGASDISLVSRYVTNFCRPHAPLHWLQLQDFHLRRYQVIGQFHQSVRSRDTVSTKQLRNVHAAADTRESRACEDRAAHPDMGKAIQDLLLGVNCYKDLEKVQKSRYGLDCDICHAAVSRHYFDLFKKVHRYSSDYILDEADL